LAVDEPFPFNFYVLLSVLSSSSFSGCCDPVAFYLYPPSVSYLEQPPLSPFIHSFPSLSQSLSPVFFLYLERDFFPGNFASHFLQPISPFHHVSGPPSHASSSTFLFTATQCVYGPAIQVQGCGVPLTFLILLRRLVDKASFPILNSSLSPRHSSSIIVPRSPIGLYATFFSSFPSRSFSTAPPFAHTFLSLSPCFFRELL